MFASLGLSSFILNSNWSKCVTESKREEGSRSVAGFFSKESVRTLIWGFWTTKSLFPHFLSPISPPTAPINTLIELLPHDNDKRRDVYWINSRPWHFHLCFVWMILDVQFFWCDDGGFFWGFCLVYVGIWVSVSVFFFNVIAMSLMIDVAIKTFWILKSPCYIEGKVCTIRYVNLLHIKEANER